MYTQFKLINNGKTEENGQLKNLPEIVENYIFMLAIIKFVVAVVA